MNTMYLLVSIVILLITFYQQWKISTLEHKYRLLLLEKFVILLSMNLLAKDFDDLKKEVEANKKILDSIVGERGMAKSPTKPVENTETKLWD